jgi:hypothetical protein
VIVSSPLEGNHWTPDITLDAAGQLYVVWDGYDGKSYNVYARCRTSQQWNPILAVAATSTFEGRAEVAAAGDGRAWVLWEEGAVNWGDVYTAKMRKAHSESIKWNDVKGPLHRHRALRLGLLSVDGSFSHVQPEIPMPSFAKAAERADAPAAVEKFGVYYERGKLTVDQSGCPWLSYRHRYVPYLGICKTSHTDEGWRVYTRRFTDQGWSPVSVFDIGQGDGMQRLASAASEDRGIAVWTTGRTDRRDNESPRGVAIATWQIEPADAPDMKPRTQLETLSEQPPAAHQPVVRDQSPEGPRIFKEIDGTRYELLFGDLHRHTDLSLCYVPADGSIEDAYRYGCDAADLDFMSITDHARDIAQGNALSLLWWRNIKQVGRHTLEPSFLPMVGYERSRGGEDHNVISLRDDVLRPHTYPHWEFWKELDTDTITIPHQTNTAPIPEGGPMPYGLNKKTWKHQNDTLRPLLEIYQGCRDRSIERDAHRAFQMGNMLGFIASSDHLSTSHSYAGVWVRNRDRESIMRAMQARRTFGATNKMQLEVTADEMWMGSHLGNRRWPEVQIHIVGTAEIEQVEVLLDGKIVHTFEPASAEAALTYQPPTVADGTHFLYVRVRQVDGHQGWSSPMWVSPGMNAAKAR